MKRTKSFLIFLSVCVLMAILAVSASAKGLTELYIDGYAATEEVEKISWSQRNNDSKNYLYIPSCADKENLAVYFTGATEITVDGVLIANGERTDVFAKEGTYTIVADGVKTTLTVKHTGQPAAIISTETGSLDKVHANKDYKEPGSIVIADSQKAQYNGNLTYIKGRGNSTWVLDKKPYNIKLEKKTDLFGMGKSKSWSLIANYYDKTFMKNEIVYTLADKVGLSFVSKQTPVCIFANGEYLGLYSLCEKVEIGDNRIEITDLEGLTEKENEAELESYPRGGGYSSKASNSYKWIDIPNDPQDITGGYLLEIDLMGRYYYEMSGFVTSRGIPVVIKEPEYASRAQVEYIRAYFQEFEDAIFSEDGYNSKGLHYSNYCDNESLVKMYIINDFSLNLDTGITSCYFYKDSGEYNMFAGPVWDYDMSLACANRRNGYDLRDPYSTFVRDGVMYDNTLCDTYFNALYDHIDFEKEVLKCWNETVKPVLPGIYEMMKNHKENIKSDAVNDYTVWNYYETTNEEVLSSNFESNTNTILTFMTTREKFLDGYYREDHSAIPSVNGSQNSADTGIISGFFDRIKEFILKIINFFAKLFK